MFSRCSTSTYTRFNVNNGIVTMQTDKPTFERSGLPGKTKIVNGQHISIVSLEMNKLKQYWNGEPHRQREKLVRACHSISTEELTWLLCDNTGSSLALDLKNDLNAKECTAEQDFYQGTTSSPSALSASPSSWSEASRKDKEEIGLYLYEWLSLFRLESPRVQSGDKVDTYLSRYQVTSCEHEQVDICKISWSGLIGTNWFQDLIRDVLAVRPAEGWISISASSFCDVGSRPGSELMILRSPTKEGQYLMWRLQCSI